MVNLITELIDIWTTAQIQKTNGGRGRGRNSNGQSPHGIKKLRELILELAVHGKLVPQDPIDLPAPQSGKFFVYALECEDKSIYIGQTDDILKRWKEHATGKGADWTKKHPPLRLVHWEDYNSREEAITREKELKTGFGRKWLKRELAAGRTRQAGEPASELLEKIAEEKACLIKEGKIKKQKPLPEISEEGKPYELPQGWEWVRLGSISQISPRNEAKNNLTASFIPMPLISTSHTGEHGQEIKTWGEIKKGYTHFADDDIGVAKITPCFENSKAVVLSGLENGIGAGTTELHIARPFGTTLAPRYILLFLKAPMFLHVGKTKMTGTAGQKRVPKEFFSETPLPLPPLAEQHRIVSKVDELMALCDQLEQQQTDSNDTHQILVETLLATLNNVADQKEFAKAWQRIANHFDTLLTTEQSIDQLKQTILQLAVMGKLVPQDPMDLPAPACASHADGPHSGKFFVYALECEDKSIYIEQTNDILNRWKKHATGKGADWTKKHPPLRLVHWEEYNSREEAITREKELKTGFGRKWLKRELAAGRTRQAGEPAIVLLEKIAKEKARLIKENKIKKQKPLPEISEEERPFKLPGGWNFVRLVALSKLITKGSSPKWQGVAYTEDTEDILFVTSENVGSYVLKLDFRKYVEKKFNEVEPRSILQKGDFLMNIVGASIGRTAIYNIDDLANINQAVCLIRVFPQFLDSQYLLHFFNSEICVSYMFDKQVDNARANLSMGNIAKFVIPFPPLAEQRRIVARIDELMTLCDTLKARLNDAQTTQVQLADAIVEQAVA